VHVTKGDVDGAHNVMAMLRDAGVDANTVTYTSLLKILVQVPRGRRPRFREGTELISVAMPEARCYPNVVTYNTIISAFAFHNQPKDAALWIQKMVGAGIRPDACTWKSIRCLREGEVEKLRVLVSKYDRIPGHWKRHGGGNGGKDILYKASSGGKGRVQLGWSSGDATGAKGGTGGGGGGKPGGRFNGNSGGGSWGACGGNGGGKFNGGGEGGSRGQGGRNGGKAGSSGGVVKVAGWYFF
jgi:pentatricopeptide repeat protein